MKQLIKNNVSTLFSFLNLGVIQASNAMIQIILIPVITRIIGLGELGHISVANAYAMIMALIINYGSNQSGVKDIAVHQNDTKKMAEIFYTIYFARLFFFTLSFIAILLLHFYWHIPYGAYFLLANTVILAETLNPFFFFVGIQNLLVYNIVNFLGRLLSAIAVIFFIKSANDSPWVNFYLGFGTSFAYGILFIYAIKKYKINYNPIRISEVKKFLFINFHLTGNNLSVQLQQSLFLFSISYTNDSLILGAYSLCDKIVWSFRLLIISFSNAIYPKAAISFNEKNERWQYYKKKINMVLFVIFTLAGICLLFLAPWITLILTGNKNELATFYIKCISFVPLVAALNSLNVIDLLMRNKYNYIFIIALLLLTITIISALLFILIGNHLIFGYYPITVEIFSLPLYWYFIQKAKSTRQLYYPS